MRNIACNASSCSQAFTVENSLLSVTGLINNLKVDMVCFSPVGYGV